MITDLLVKIRDVKVEAKVCREKTSELERRNGAAWKTIVYTAIKR